MNTAAAQALLAAVKLQAAREVLELTTRNGASDRDAGRRVLLLAFITAPELIGSQRELAKRMGVSEARVSQMLRTFKRFTGRIV